jgi:quinol monooxygenase YgiN
MARITFTATMTAPGRSADLVDILRDLTAAADDEPGTLLYSFHRLDEDPDTFVSFEVFADQAAVDAHVASTAVQTAVARLRELGVVSSVRRGQPLFGEELP